MNVQILFSSHCANYSEDILAAGLKGVLGHLLPVEFKPSVHDEFCPKTAPEGSCWMPLRLGPTYPPDFETHGTDLLVVGNPADADRLEIAERAMARARSFGVRIVMIDGEDQPKLDRMNALLPEGPWYVRECLPEMLADDRVRPFPFAVNTNVAPRPKPWRERDIDVLWGGSVGYGGRDPFVAALRSLPKSVRTEIIEGRTLSLADWNDRLTRAKIVICLRGAGRMTYRYFEAPAAGALALSQEHGLVIPNDFMFSRFNAVDQMRYWIEKILNDDKQAEAAACELHEHAWLHHSMTARASQFLISAFR